MARGTEQGHIIEDKRKRLPGVAPHNPGLISPGDRLDDSLIETISWLPVVGCVVVQLFHSLGKEHFVHGAPSRHHGIYPFALRDHGIDQDWSRLGKGGLQSG